MLLDDHKLTNMARPGTSISRIGTSNKGVSPLVRPVTSSGRPLSGVVRPQSSQRQGTTSMNNHIRQQTGYRTGTARLMSSGGRYLRIATSTLQSLNSSLSLNINDIIPKQIVKKRSSCQSCCRLSFIRLKKTMKNR